MVNAIIAQVISTGIYHSLVRCGSGIVMTWGGNTGGQLGDNTLTQRNSPIQMNNITNAVSVSAGGLHSLILKNDGTVWACGSNSQGQLGDGTTLGKKTPVQVVGLSEVIAITTTVQSNIALKENGTVWTWGDNYYGQLGDGTLTQKVLPAPVPGLTNIISIAGGESFVLALKNDGTVWTWGRNHRGQLGDSTNVNKSLPVQAKGLQGITFISAGNSHAFAIKNDGTVYGWGYNFYGQLGDGTINSRIVPTPFTGINGLTSVSCGTNSTHAIKSDGTVWGWGKNNNRELGDGTTIQRMTPILIPVLNNIIEISGNNMHTIALKSDGTVWGAGQNLYGEVGDGTTSFQNSFVQLTGSCLVEPVLGLQTTIINSTCINSNNGSAIVTPTGGIPPYSFLWSDGQNTATATNLASGIYTITVADSIGATVMDTVTILAGAQLSTNPTDVLCNGDSSGTINLLVSGGSGNFSYSWSNGATTSNLNTLAAGDYTVIVTDISCSDTLSDTVAIEQPLILTSAFSSSTPAVCGTNGSLSVTAFGGMAPYHYLWNNGATTSSINHLPSGTYTVAVIDTNGCTNIVTDSVLLQSPMVLANISSQTDVLCNFDTDGSATVSVSTGTPSYTYSWNTTPLQTTPTAIGLSAGIYIVTITDSNGCSNIDTATINIIHPLFVTINATATIVPANTSVILEGNGATNYSWTGNITNGIPFTPISSATYTVTGTDSTGCTNTAAITITVKSDYHSIAAGGFHSLHNCTNNIPEAFGYNGNGQLGIGTNDTISHSHATQLNALSDIISVAAGNDHSLFLKGDRTVWASGNNQYGQLGDGTTTSKNSPIQITSLNEIVDVAVGWNHSFFLKNDGTVWACGSNFFGQLGDGTTVNKSIPTQISSLTGIIAMAGGEYHSIFLKNDGTVWTCGSNYNGQLGDNTTIDQPVPIHVNSLSGITAISAGGVHSLFLKSNGTVMACGFNQDGQLGDNTSTDRHSPILINSINGIVSIAAGQYYSLFRKNNGTVWACGYNFDGELGDGTIITRHTPVQVSTITNVNEISAGMNHSLFLKNDGSVFGCGINEFGRLGDGTTIDRHIPTAAINLCSYVNNVWPGDSNNDSIVNNYDLLPIGLYYSLTGYARTMISNMWQAYLSTDWGTFQTNGSNIKHADCNGNGVIDDNDTLAINLNFNSIHAFSPSPEYSNSRQITSPIYFITSNTTYQAGDTVDVELWLGTSIDMVNDIYGIAFDINYTSSLIEPGTETINYPNSWLGTPGLNSIKMAKIEPLSSTAYGAIVRTNHINANGFGKIADFKFQIKNSISSNATMNLSISNYKAIDSSGTNILLVPQNQSISVIPASTGIAEIHHTSLISVYPNPNDGNFIFSNLKDNDEIEIFDVMGLLIHQTNSKSSNCIINLRDKAKGIYFYKVSNCNMVAQGTIVIQ